MKTIIVLENFEFRSSKRVNIKDFLNLFKKFNENCFIRIDPEVNSDDVFIEVSRYETEEERDARLIKENNDILDKLTTKEREVAISLIKRGIRLS